MTSDTVKAEIVAALEMMFQNDRHLFDSNANERAITHKLAAYLNSIFIDFSVDCEYNRFGERPKILEALKEIGKSGKAYPDIIIHEPGIHGRNLLVIEAKKQGASCAIDLMKLEAYKNELHYEYACMIVFPSSKAQLDQSSASDCVSMY